MRPPRLAVAGPSCKPRFQRTALPGGASNQAPGESTMKVARQKQVSVPVGVCLSCFNEQQQFAFPFLVYCPHSETLAIMSAPDEHATFQCAPSQLKTVLEQLQSGRHGVAKARRENLKF